MKQLLIPIPEAEPLKVLCLGAHSDDIEIGCGGTILSLKEQYPRIHFDWVVFSSSEQRTAEAAKAAELFTKGSGCEFQVLDFRDGFFPFQGADVKDYFENLKPRVNPDVIFTHWRGDAHQDHRLLSELTWNTFRNHLILEYEIPKYDGDAGRPNLYFPISEANAQKKCDFLSEAFASQASKRWFEREVFLGLMRIRGMEANCASRYAEAFHARKIVVQGNSTEVD
ncbi:MAG: PIG-L family deacetylase [Bryobacteraceae bacterium]|nr:PIG-L family deacetylase [Bryobacteraceae bacterium]